MQIPAPDAHQCVIGVAIALPSHYAAQVRAVREAAGDPLAEVVPPHITLLPPTAIDVDSLDEVKRHLRNVAAGTSPFEVRLDEVGTFRPVSPVVYLGLRSGAEECDRLQVRVRDRRGPLARSLSFPFHPHVDPGPRYRRGRPRHRREEGSGSDYGLHRHQASSLPPPQPALSPHL